MPAGEGQKPHIVLGRPMRLSIGRPKCSVDLPSPRVFRSREAVSVLSEMGIRRGLPVRLVAQPGGRARHTSEPSRCRPCPPGPRARTPGSAGVGARGPRPRLRRRRRNADLRRRGKHQSHLPEEVVPQLLQASCLQRGGGKVLPMVSERGRSEQRSATSVDVSSKNPPPVGEHLEPQLCAQRCGANASTATGFHRSRDVEVRETTAQWTLPARLHLKLMVRPKLGLEFDAALNQEVAARKSGQMPGKEKNRRGIQRLQA